MSRKLWAGLSVVFLIVFLMQMVFNIRKRALENRQPPVPEIVVDMASLNEATLSEDLGKKEKKEKVKIELAKPLIKEIDTELPKDIAQIQRGLKAAGFDPGTIDGKLGSKTKAAIRNFQKTHDLKVDGKVGRNTWRLLKRYLKE